MNRKRNAKRGLRKSGSNILKSEAIDTSTMEISRRHFHAIKSRANGTSLTFSGENEEGGRSAANDRKESLRKKITYIPRKKPTVCEEYERRRRMAGEGGANMKAQELMDDQLDEVKSLKVRLNLMKIQGIRKQQVREREEMKQEEKDYDLYWDRVMEEKRQQDVSQEVKHLKELQKQRKQYSSDLILQVDEAEKRKLLEEERVEQEKIQMRKQIERLQQMEIEKQEKKKIDQRKRLEYLVKENEKNARYKDIKAREEKEENERIISYIARKEYENEVRLAEKIRVRMEKERETARLRALQMRTTDKKAEEDAKRAKRRTQEYQRQEDLKRERKIQAKEALMREVLAERKRQIALKKLLLEAAKKEDKKFMERIKKEQVTLYEREEAVKEAKREKARQHAKDVIQMDVRRRKIEKTARMRQREEDQRNAMDGDVYTHRVQEVMAQKMREHIASGFPLPPDLVRPHESEEEKKARKARLYRSRPLW